MSNDKFTFKISLVPSLIIIKSLQDSSQVQLFSNDPFFSMIKWNSLMSLFMFFRLFESSLHLITPFNSNNHCLNPLTPRSDQ